MKKIGFAFLLVAAAIPLSAQSVLTLEEAVRTALERNRPYRIAVDQERAAANGVSWGEAGALPKVDLTGGYSESVNDTRQERVNAPVEVKNGAKSSATSAGVNASWTVFEGLSSLAAHGRLETEFSLARLRREQARQELIAGVVLSYGAVLKEKRILGAMDSSVALSRERVKINEGKYRLGSLSKLDLLQAKLDLNADISARLKQQAVFEEARRSLNRLLSRDASSPLEISDSVALAPPLDYDALRAAALEKNPGLRQAAGNKRLAELGVREYVGGLFPKLALTAGYNYNLSESNAGFLRSNQAAGWTYGANLRFNLFDGFALRRDYRNARLAVSGAELGYEEVRAGIEADMERARDEYRNALELLGLERDNLETARQTVGMAMERLRLGSITALDLRAAQEKYVNAETRLNSAGYEAKRAETRLLLLAGRLGT